MYSAPIVTIVISYKNLKLSIFVILLCSSPLMSGSLLEGNFQLHLNKTFFLVKK